MTVKTVRGLTVTEWADIIREEVQLELQRATHNCESCEHFDEKSQLCRLANQMPPPRIAIHGCENWSELIPF